MSEAPEPDSTPVTREHVEALLKWYGTKCRLPQYLGRDDHWFHALQTLTLGDLRNGMRWLASQTKVTYFDPVSFWHLARNRRSPETSARIKALRASLNYTKQTEEPNEPDQQTTRRP